MFSAAYNYISLDNIGERIVEIKTFLERVLPETGQYYVIATLDNAGRWKEHAVDSLDSLVTEATQKSNANLNVYFATSTFSKAKRGAALVEGKKSLYLDIDVGEGKEYPTYKDALKALRDAIATGDLPKPSLLVKSGHGVHVYWILDKIIGREIWLTAARALAQHCTSIGLRVDEKITEDAARVLRVVNTWNIKADHEPIKCELIVDFGVVYAYEELIAQLGVASPQETTNTDINSDLSANLSSFNKEWFAGPIMEKCAVMRHAKETGGEGLSGAMWSQQLHLLAYTEDGHTYIHDIARSHAEYTPDETEKRFSISLAKRQEGELGPTTCAKLQSQPCNGCPYLGKITSPIVLGIAEFIDLPKGYTQTKTGVYKEGKADKDGKPKYEFIMPYRVLRIQAGRDMEGASASMCFLTLGVGSQDDKGSTVRTVAFNYSNIMSDSGELSGKLSHADIVLNSIQLKAFKDFIVAWLHDLQSVDKVDQTSQHMGWVNTKDKAGFAVGADIYWGDGTNSPLLRAKDQLVKQYQPKGNREAWQTCCDFVLAQGRQELAAVIAGSFAGPLVKFTGESGGLLSIYSKQSATGKTTAMKIAQGVWGNPTEAMFSLNDTTNSVIRKMGKICNITVLWDELRMPKEISSFVQLVFQLYQGKEKSRLTSNSDMMDVGTWNTLLMAATNEPLSEHIKAIVKGTDAGLVRIFEVECNQPISLTGKALSDAQDMFNKLSDNYGHAGRVYAAYLAENEEKIIAQVEQTKAKISVAVNATQPDRFHMSILTTLIVGAQIAKQLGLANFDIPKLLAFLIAEFRVMRDSTTASTKIASTPAAVVNYMSEYVDSSLRTQSTSSVLGKSKCARGVELLGLPKRTPIMYRQHNKTELIVPALALNKFAFDSAGLFANQIEHELKKCGAVYDRITLGAGCGDYSTGRSWCYLIDLTHPSLADYWDSEVTTEADETNTDLTNTIPPTS